MRCFSVTLMRFYIGTEDAGKKPHQSIENLKTYRNNSIIEFRVPVSLALSLCQYALRPRRGLGQASPSREAPRLQALETGPLSST